MITVNRGYTLDLHPPAEREYRFQSVPSGIVRSTVQPVLVPPVEDEAPALRLTTQELIYFTDDWQELPLTATSISFYSRSASVPEYHVISSEPNPLTGIYQVTLDGSGAFWNIGSTAPIVFSLMTDRAHTDSSGAYAYESRLFAKYLNAEGYNIAEAYALRPYDLGTWIKAQEIVIETAAVQQQEYLYTVTGGVVPTGGE